MEDMLIISDLHINQWHSDAHLRQRKKMLQTLLFLMKQTHARTLSQRKFNPQLDRIAARLELILYSRSASFEEYSNFRTLRRRLRFLISSVFRQAEHENPKFVKRFSYKRQPTFNSSYSPLLRKNPVEEIEVKTRDKPYEVFLFDNQNDLIRLTYSFLDGRSICKHTAVNRSACRILRTCVKSLSLDINLYAAAIRSKSGFFQQFPNLEDLMICRTFIEKSLSDCVQLDVNCHNHGELIVRSLAITMEAGNLKQLRRLKLNSLYANTAHVDGTTLLATALSKGSCPHLEYLALGGNSLGDCGAVSISIALGSGKIPFISYLDIRKNFIGEKGAISICKALLQGYCPRLVTFLAEGNIFDDRCASIFAATLKSGKCRSLTTLGLENNFIETSGFYQLSDACCSVYCPLLRHIGLEGNNIECITTRTKNSCQHIK